MTLFRPALNLTHFLQAFRHLYVLAAVQRGLLAINVDSNEAEYVPLSIITKADAHGQSRMIHTIAPCILPELSSVARVTVEGPRYWAVTLDLSTPAAYQRTGGVLYVQRKAGQLPYAKDSKVLNALANASNRLLGYAGRPALPSLPADGDGKGGVAGRGSKAVLVDANDGDGDGDGGGGGDGSAASASAGGVAGRRESGASIGDESLSAMVEDDAGDYDNNDGAGTNNNNNNINNNNNNSAGTSLAVASSHSRNEEAELAGAAGGVLATGSSGGVRLVRSFAANPLAAAYAHAVCGARSMESEAETPTPLSLETDFSTFSLAVLQECLSEDKVECQRVFSAIHMLTHSLGKCVM